MRPALRVLNELDPNKLSLSQSFILPHVSLSLQETSGAKDLIILTLDLVVVPGMQRALHIHTL